MARTGEIRLSIDFDEDGLARLTRYAERRSDARPEGEDPERTALFHDKWLLIRDLIGAKHLYPDDAKDEYLAFLTEMVTAYRNRELRPRPSDPRHRTG